MEETSGCWKCFSVWGIYTGEYICQNTLKLYRSLKQELYTLEHLNYMSLLKTAGQHLAITQVLFSAPKERKHFQPSYLWVKVQSMGLRNAFIIDYIVSKQNYI